MDIVEKMRNYGHLDAADEIERLREALKFYALLNGEKVSLETSPNWSLYGTEGK